MTENEPKRNVWFVGLLSFFGGISQDIFAPILPLYLTSVLGFDKAFVGIAEGVVTAGANIFKVVAGWLSDRYRRQKPLIFIGYLLSLLGRVLLVPFTAASAVISLRALDGAGKGLKDPPKDVLIAGSASASQRGRSFGLARMLDTLGSVVGPLLLFGLLYLFQNSATLYHNILLFSAVPLLVTLIILVTKVRETPRGHAVAQEISPVALAKPGRTFYLFLLIVLIFTLGNSSDAFLILRAKNLGLTLLEIPLVIALFNLVYAGLAVPFGALSDRIGRLPTITIGWLMYGLVYLGFALTTSANLVWLLYGLYGIYYATSEGVAKAFLADLVPAGARGRAFGIYGTTIGLATLPASFLAGWLWDRFGPQAPFYFGALMAALALGLLIGLGRTLRPVPSRV